MDIRTTLRHTAEHFRTGGVTGTTLWIIRRFQWRWLERRYGIRTEAVIPMTELGIDNGESGEYVATDYSDFGRIMRALDLEPSEHVFVDFGAGMGRVMILAATYPFRRVVGIEHSPELAKIAGANIERSRPRLRCQALDIATCDAALYKLPRDSSVLYFYNPFHGAVLEAVLRNIRDLIEAARHPIWIVCNVPPTSPFEDQMRRHEWLDLKSEFPLAELHRCLIFQTRPVA